MTGTNHDGSNGPVSIDNTPAGPGSAVRITVGLVSQAATDLQATHDRTGLSKTDIVNRALTLYEFVDAELRAGAELTVRRRDGQHLLVKLL